MRMDTKFMRLSISFALIFLFLGIAYFYSYKSTEIEAEHNCKKIEQTEDYCIFNCSFHTDSKVKGRIIVTHTVWASIFEEDFEAKDYSTLIKLPRRKFNYWMRVGFYNLKNKKLYEYGMLEDWLKC